MNPDIDIARIMTSQNDLRNVSQISQMIDYVDAGGYFTLVDLVRYVTLKSGRPNPPLIALTEFPDDVLMAHDGHHRLVSSILAGRRILRGDEYIIKRFTYPDYTEINLSNGWSTPFDPVTEIRLSDFGPFKLEVRRLLSESMEKAEAYIRANRHLYSAPRDIKYVSELADRVQTRLASDTSAEHGSGFCLATRW